MKGSIIRNGKILDKIELLGNEVAAFYDEKVEIARELRNKNL